MIADRRARKRPLIRTTAMTAILARNLTAMSGLVRRRQSQKSQGFAGQEHKTVSSLSSYATSSSLSESKLYLQQLAALHVAGVLTDEEYIAAQQRLLGS